MHGAPERAAFPLQSARRARNRRILLCFGQSLLRFVSFWSVPDLGKRLSSLVRGLGFLAYAIRIGWHTRITARSIDGGKGSLPWGSWHPTPRTQTRRPEPVHCPARLPSALPVPYSLHPTTRCLPAPTSACPPALPLCPARGHPCPCPLPCARGVELALRVHSTAVRPRGAGLRGHIAAGQHVDAEQHGRTSRCALARCWKCTFHVPLARWPASHLCQTVASTTSRSARLVVDSCQPPINYCHRN